MNPNLEQQAAIDTHEGEICLEAGPGTGKTATLVARHKSLVASGVRPEEILCVTFTKEAALTMQKRAGPGLFKTFHSYGYSVLTAEKGRIPMEPVAKSAALSTHQKVPLGLQRPDSIHFPCASPEHHARASHRGT